MAIESRIGIVAVSDIGEEDEARRCLLVLRDGSPSDKILARQSLAQIFTRRGLFDEATELYEANVRAGVRSPEIFELLGQSYRRIGEHEAADASLAEAARLRAAAVRPAPASQPTAMPRMPAVPSPVAPRQQPPASPRSPSEDDFGLTPDPRMAQGSPVDANGRVLQFPGPTARMAPHPTSDARPGGPAETERLPAAYRYDPDAGPHDDGDLQPASAAQQRPRTSGPAIPAVILVPLLILFVVALPVGLLALLVVNPIALYLEGRPAGPTVDVTASGPAQLKVAAGAATNWYVHTGRSVSGLWASPGLEMTLERGFEGTGPTFAVTAARPQGWGETITIVERRGQGRANQEMVLPATFVAPANLPASGTVINGKIEGQVTAPRLSETGQFNTTTESVSVPVQLVIVSTPELWLDRFLNSLQMYFDEDRWLLVTIGALLTWCVLAGGTAILFRSRQT